MTSRYPIPLNEVELTAVRAQGAGGQNGNSTAPKQDTYYFKSTACVKYCYFSQILWVSALAVGLDFCLGSEYFSFCSGVQGAAELSTGAGRTCSIWFAT